MRGDIVFYVCKNCCFTLAETVERIAVDNGATPRVEKKTGQRHPGSHVNECIKRVLKNPATAAVYRLGPADVCELDVRHPGNFAVVDQLIEDNIINTELVKDNKIYVYSKYGAEVAVKAMTQNPSLSISEEDITFDFSFRNIELCPVKAQFKKKRHSPSLVDKIQGKDFSETAEDKRSKNSEKFRPKTVLDGMSKEDQDAVRRYFKEVRFTRSNGRPYRKRGGANNG